MTNADAFSFQALAFIQPAKLFIAFPAPVNMFDKPCNGSANRLSAFAILLMPLISNAPIPIAIAAGSLSFINSTRPFIFSLSQSNLLPAESKYFLTFSLKLLSVFLILRKRPLKLKKYPKTFLQKSFTTVIIFSKDIESNSLTRFTKSLNCLPVSDKCFLIPEAALENDVFMLSMAFWTLGNLINAFIQFRTTVIAFPTIDITFPIAFAIMLFSNSQSLNLTMASPTEAVKLRTSMSASLRT